MTTVSNNIIITAADVNRASGNVFGQKQTWYKEMEKARQLLSTGNQDKTPASFSDAESNADQESVPYSENKDARESSVKPVNASETPSGVSSAPAANLASGFVTPDSMLITNLPSGVNAGVMFRLLPSLTANNQPGLTQPMLLDVERVIRSEIQPQNLQFINGSEGLRIYFRDYRLDDNEARKVIDKIKQLLAKLNIDISDIVVNGNLIEQKQAVNQEAT